jgi:hypothetical protein
LLHTKGGTIGQLVAGVPSGLSLTSPEETKNKNAWLRAHRLRNPLVTEQGSDELKEKVVYELQ